ncbi:zinc finger protein 638-like isoform X3 [Scophthalmus maximus]|uniref:zinc finger protein 638-like isoform X3 n=1 Tax=Scophthalmus maximus TaxID=52904 RepID=UPI001FA85D30|nr:zinc finger protein 638-like isoform X3 [Scophthalmus maximus]
MLEENKAGSSRQLRSPDTCGQPRESKTNGRTRNVAAGKTINTIHPARRFTLQLDRGALSPSPGPLTSPLFGRLTGSSLLIGQQAASLRLAQLKAQLALMQINNALKIGYQAANIPAPYPTTAPPSPTAAAINLLNLLKIANAMSHPLFNPYASGNQSSTQGPYGLSSMQAERDPRKDSPQFGPGSSFCSSAASSATPANAGETTPSPLAQSVSYRPEQSWAVNDKDIERSVDMHISRARDVTYHGKQDHQPIGQSTLFTSTQRDDILSSGTGTTSSPIASTPASLGHRYSAVYSGSSSLDWFPKYKMAATDDSCQFYSSPASSSYTSRGSGRFNSSSGRERDVQSIPGLGDFDYPVQVAPSRPKYTPECASNILSKFGLEKEDLEYLISYPDDQMTPANLPFILHQIRIDKAKRATTAVESNPDPETPPIRGVSGMGSLSSSGGSAALLQPPKVVDYGHTGNYAGGVVDEIGRTSGRSADSDGSGSLSCGNTWDIRSRHSQEDTKELKSSAPGSSHGQCSSVTNSSYNSTLSSVAARSNHPAKPLKTKPMHTPQKVLCPSSLPRKDKDGGLRLEDCSKSSPLKKTEAERSQSASNTQPSCGLHPDLTGLVLIGTDSTIGAKTHSTTPAKESVVHKQTQKRQNQKLHMQEKQVQKKPVSQMEEALSHLAFSATQPSSPILNTTDASQTVQPSVFIPCPAVAPPASLQLVAGLENFPWSRTQHPAERPVSEGLPTPSMMRDYAAATPQVFPHTCSLCYKECAHMKDWVTHQNTSLHLESRGVLRAKYPEWNGGIEVGPSSPSRAQRYGCYGSPMRSLEGQRRCFSPSRRYDRRSSPRRSGERRYSPRRSCEIRSPPRTSHDRRSLSETSLQRTSSSAEKLVKKLLEESVAHSVSKQSDSEAVGEIEASASTKPKVDKSSPPTMALVCFEKEEDAEKLKSIKSIKGIPVTVGASVREKNTPQRKTPPREPDASGVSERKCTKSTKTMTHRAAAPTLHQTSPDRSTKPLTSPDRPTKPLTSPDRSTKPLTSPDRSTKPLTSPDRPTKPLTSPDRPTKPLTSLDRPTKPLTSPDRSTKPLTSPDRSTKPLTSPDRPTKPLTSPDRSTKPLTSPDRPTKPLTSPDRPTKPLTSPDRSTKPLTSPDRPTKPLTSPDRPTKSLSSPDRPTKSLSSPDRPTKSLSSPDRSTKPLTSPDRPTKPLSSPDRPTKPLTSPDRPTKPLSSPDRPTKPLSSPDRPTKPLSSPDRPTKPLSSPDRPTKPLSSPDRPTKPLTSPDRPTKPLSSPDRPTKPPSSPDRPTKPLTSPDRPSKPFSSPSGSKTTATGKRLASVDGAVSAARTPPTLTVGEKNEKCLDLRRIWCVDKSQFCLPLQVQGEFTAGVVSSDANLNGVALVDVRETSPDPRRSPNDSKMSASSSSSSSTSSSSCKPTKGSTKGSSSSNSTSVSPNNPKDASESIESPTGPSSSSPSSPSPETPSPAGRRAPRSKTKSPVKALNTSSFSRFETASTAIIEGSTETTPESAEATPDHRASAESITAKTVESSETCPPAPGSGFNQGNTRKDLEKGEEKRKDGDDPDKRTKQEDVGGENDLMPDSTHEQMDDGDRGGGCGVQLPEENLQVLNGEKEPDASFQAVDAAGQEERKSPVGDNGSSVQQLSEEGVTQVSNKPAVEHTININPEANNDQVLGRKRASRGIGCAKKRKLNEEEDKMMKSAESCKASRGVDKPHEHIPKDEEQPLNVSDEKASLKDLDSDVTKQETFEALDSIDDQRAMDDDGQKVEPPTDQMSKDIKGIEVEGDANRAVDSVADADNKDKTVKRVKMTPRRDDGSWKRSGPRTRASKREEKEKSPLKPDGRVIKSGTRTKTGTTAGVSKKDQEIKEEVYEILDSVDDEPVRDATERSVRRRSQRGKKEEKTDEESLYEVLDSVEDEAATEQPTVMTRSTRGRRGRTSKKDSPIDKTKEEDTPTRRSRTPARESQEAKKSYITVREVRDEDATFEILDSVEDEAVVRDDRPTTGGRGKRGRPTKAVKATKKERRREKEGEEEEVVVDTKELVTVDEVGADEAGKEMAAWDGKNVPGDEEKVEWSTLELRPPSKEDESVDSLNPETSLTLDEPGDDEEEKKTRKHDVTVVSKRRRRRKELVGPEAKRSRSQSPRSSANVKLPPFIPNNPLGQEFVVPKSGYFCNLCRVFYLNQSSGKEQHCVSQRHYDNLQKHYQKLQDKPSRSSTQYSQGVVSD